MWDSMMGAGMVLWLLVSVAVLALLVLGIVWLFRRLQRSPGDPSAAADGNAVRELEMRYARGEIDRDTYLTMREDLRHR